MGEEALSPEERQYLEFEQNYERRFVSQDAYENRTIFESLDLAWDLLESFPPIALKKISPAVRNMFYTRTDRVKTKEKMQAVPSLSNRAWALYAVAVVWPV